MFLQLILASACVALWVFSKCGFFLIHRCERLYISSLSGGALIYLPVIHAHILNAAASTTININSSNWYAMKVQILQLVISHLSSQLTILHGFSDTTSAWKGKNEQPGSPDYLLILTWSTANFYWVQPACIQHFRVMYLIEIRLR